MTIKNVIGLVKGYGLKIEPQSVAKEAEEIIISALDLINRYEEKNSNLTSDLTSLQNDFTSAKADIKKLTSGKCVYLSDDETIEYCVEGPCPNYKTVAQIKAEAYKECVEKLKKQTDCLWVGGYRFTATDLDNLLKELVGEHNSTNIDKQN